MSRFSHHSSGIVRWLAVAGVSIVIVSLGINATDNTRFFTASIVNPKADDSRCPEGMVFVSAPGGGFCIDAYEASADRKTCPNGNPSSQDQTRNNLDAKDCKPVSAPDSAPWTNISQNQAQAACAKAQKHLATNREWYLAALGTPDKDSGWGPDDCNVAGNREEKGLSTGAGRGCVSSQGAHDMIGNVWELVDDTATDGLYRNTALPDTGFVTETDEDGVPTRTLADAGDPNYHLDTFAIIREGRRSFMRGGYIRNESDAGVAMTNLFLTPSAAGEFIGFRCAK